jgi:hypothetical protein
MRTIVAAAVMLALAVVMLPSLAAAQVVRSASGTTPGSIQSTVDQYRLDLGAFTEINWDGVPDAQAAPNGLPSNFFNSSGILLATPGTSFQVSADLTFPMFLEFNNIDPTYSATFATFSPERLFTPIGSNIFDVQFVVPGTSTPALTTGFGAIFTDVDLASTTSLTFFNASNASLGTFFAPAISGNETFSFLGVSFPTAVVSRVRITAGNAALAAGVTDINSDLVVLDNVIFGARPSAVPEPGSVLVLGVGLAGVASAACRRRRG